MWRTVWTIPGTPWPACRDFGDEESATRYALGKAEATVHEIQGGWE